MALINSSRSKGLAKLALPLVAPGLAASIGAAVLLGAAGYAFTAVSVVALSGGIIMVPLRYYPALVLLALVIVPAVNLSLEAETPILLKPLAGQASAVFVLGTASLGRFLISGRRFRLPFFVWSALGLYIVFIGATLLVGAVQDSLADSFVDDSRRKLTYMLAVFVGAIAVTDGGSGWQHKNLIAPVAGLSAALSIWYWLWANVSLPAPPFLTELFENAAGAFAYGARSVFPFSQDSPNGAAIVFVVLATLVAVPLLKLTDERPRIGTWIVIILLALATLSTESRTGLLVAGVALISWLLMTGGNRRLLLVGASIAIAAIVFLSWNQFMGEDRALTLAASTFEARLEIWSQAGTEIRDSPILGHGFGYSAQPRFSQGGSSSIDGSTPSLGLTSIHNDYLGAILDGGVLGLSLLIGVLFSFLALGTRLFLQPEASGVGVGFLSFLIALITSMLTIASFQLPTLQVFIWLFLGIAGATLANSNHVEAQESRPPSVARAFHLARNKSSI